VQEVRIKVQVMCVLENINIGVIEGRTSCFKAGLCFCCLLSCCYGFVSLFLLPMLLFTLTFLAIFLDTSNYHFSHLSVFQPFYLKLLD
jgi:hypothetical protein